MFCIFYGRLILSNNNLLVDRCSVVVNMEMDYIGRSCLVVWIKLFMILRYFINEVLIVILSLLLGWEYKIVVYLGKVRCFLEFKKCLYIIRNGK